MIQSTRYESNKKLIMWERWSVWIGLFVSFFVVVVCNMGGRLNYVGHGLQNIFFKGSFKGYVRSKSPLFDQPNPIVHVSTSLIKPTYPFRTDVRNLFTSSSKCWMNLVHNHLVNIFYLCPWIYYSCWNNNIPVGII